MRPREASAAGLVGSAAVTGATALVHTLVRSVPFLPLALAQAVVRAAPGGFATFVIERLGHWALKLAVAGTLAAFLVSGAAVGLLIPPVAAKVRKNLPVAGALAFLPLWLFSVLVAPRPAGSIGRVPFAAAVLPIYVLGGVLAGWTLGRLSGAAERGATDLTRRYVLRALWWGSVAAVVGGADLGRLLFRQPDPGRLALSLPNLTRAPAPERAASDAAFTGIPGLTPEITTNGAFYVVDEEIIDPDIDPEAWRLTVGGLVNRPLGLTYGDVRRLPAIERYQTLECISNEVGGDLVSTAKWAGVPLPTVLDRAGVGPGAVEVVFRAAGGYTESLSVDQAMDPSTLLAVGMNDRVLPRAHGFPVRVLSVGTYGMKNPKWLESIEVVDRPYRGYWEQRGWSKAAVVKTMSRVDVPRSGERAAGSVAIAGVAFAGNRGVSRVEVSTNGGKTWAPAELETALSSLTWRRWLFRWAAPGSGTTGILVRAYDGRGALQIPRFAAPHPDGASGYHAITVRG